MNDDSISRKQAIEAVQNRHFTLSKEKVLLINDLEKLPSVQPEIIWCKDCRLYTQPEQGKVYGRCTFTRDSTPRKQNDFCSYAKRRHYEI